MLQQTLYDIENYNDFEDSLVIMKSMKDKSYNLIFFELPRIVPNSEHTYDLTPEFLGDCLSNAHRLLKDDGILVVFAPHIPCNNHDYRFLLNQIFPSITDIAHTHNLGMVTHVNTIFFCNKQPAYKFQIFTTFRPKESYNYEDTKGLYRLDSGCLSSLKGSVHYHKYVWNGIHPPKGKGWRYTEEEMNRLNCNGKIVVKKSRAFLKIYRQDEAFPAPPIWNITADIMHNINICDYISISRILSAYCKSGDSVFCPFDYEGWFPIASDEHKLSWTSIKVHTYCHTSLPASSLVTTLPLRPRQHTSSSEIITDISTLNELKNQLADLTAPLIPPEIRAAANTINDIPYINPVATGANLKRIRKLNNLSVKDVADFFCGMISETSIYYWEQGKHLPKMHHFTQLALLYNVSSLDELIVISPPKDDM